MGPPTSTIVMEGMGGVVSVGDEVGGNGTELGDLSAAGRRRDFQATRVVGDR